MRNGQCKQETQPQSLQKYSSSEFRFDLINVSNSGFNEFFGQEFLLVNISAISRS